MGAYPPMGTPSPPYPPLYMSFCQFRGDNPLYNEFKNFGKNCSPTHKWGGGISFYPYICGVETEDKISFNYTDGLDIHDDVYRKVIKDFNILYERDKMGGNKGVHLGVMEHDPPFEKGPIF